MNKATIDSETKRREVMKNQKTALLHEYRDLRAQVAKLKMQRNVLLDTLMEQENNAVI